jgi:hypothetical protein
LALGSDLFTVIARLDRAIHAARQNGSEIRGMDAPVKPGHDDGGGRE